MMFPEDVQFPWLEEGKSNGDITKRYNVAKSFKTHGDL